MKLAVYGKGGIGKSTTSCNISVALAKRGKKRHRQSLKIGGKAGSGSNSADCVRLSGLAKILAVHMCVPDLPLRVNA